MRVLNVDGKIAPAIVCGTLYIYIINNGKPRRPFPAKKHAETAMKLHQHAYLHCYFWLLFAASAQAQPGDLVLHYDKPASAWTEALPVGNGRLGAMVFGKVNEEVLQLNEATLWSGGPVGKNINPQAFSYLAPLRQALLDDDYARATALAKHMQGLFSESYLPLGDLLITQDVSPDVTAYQRALNIRDAIATTDFDAEGIHYTREVFASAPANVMVVRFSADQARHISLHIRTRSALHFSNSIRHDELILSGKTPAHVDPSYFNVNRNPVIYDDPAHCKGMRFELIVKPVVKDGTVKMSNNQINISNASEVVLLLSAATSFNGFDHCPDSQGLNQHVLAQSMLDKAAHQSFTQLFNAHEQDFHHYFDRVSLTLNPDEADRSALSTDERLADYTRNENDSALEALYFQYGRYLLISSARTRNAPANLQGIWNRDVRPPWSSNYTTNINLEMNYWPVEAANLTEMFTPLDDLIHHLAVTGHDTAASFYHAPGWMLHHNSDIWAMSYPVGDLGKGDPTWASWYMGGDWLSRHLWEHYQYTGDVDFLRHAYPLMKGAAQFTLAWLQPWHGYLVTMPSTSPENVFYFGDHQQGNVSIASTMDMSIIRDLFSNLITASEILGTDVEFRKQLQDATAKLFPLQIGSKGQIQEWYRDFEEVDPHHRHTSHLYGLYPADEISPLNTPAFAAAAKRTLELRGDDGTGWSLAWKVNMWARLLDGNHAYRLLRNMFRLTRETDIHYGEHGGAYPNLFDAHPPFQIDGNFGGTAGMMEMLLQSQDHVLHLLPALPDAWAKGSVAGLVGRGNFVVNMQWSAHQLQTADILSRSGGPCTIRAAVPFEIKSLQLHSEAGQSGYTLSFISKRGETYQVSAR